jgi:hypothetical protein
VIDERDGRSVARRLGRSITGTKRTMSISPRIFWLRPAASSSAHNGRKTQREQSLRLFGICSRSIANASKRRSATLSECFQGRFTQSPLAVSS